jgi:hypothetical protein
MKQYFSAQIKAIFCKSTNAKERSASKIHDMLRAGGDQ